MFHRTTPYQEGSREAKILFVAEAPGADEMRRGRPLVGPTGKIFDECLHRAGLLRNQVAIANVCRERIKSVNYFIGESSGNLSERGLEVQKDLLSRIEDHQANVIVPMGKLATACLRPETKGRILKWRGSILHATALGNRKIIPTVHPAFTMPRRGPFVYQYTITEDYRRVLKQSEFPEIRRPKRTLLIDPTFYEAVEFIRSCADFPLIGSDCETYNYQVSCLSLAPTADYCMSIPFVGRYRGEAHWSEREELLLWLELAKLFNSPSVCSIWQGGVSFDIPLLYLQNKIRIRRYHDLMVAHRIAFPDFPAKLEYITSIFTEEPYYKDERKLWMTPSKDPDTFWTYNAKDGAVTREAWDPVWEIISNDEGYLWTYENTMASNEACLYAGCRGVRVDRDKLESLRKEVQATIDSQQAELNNLVGRELNVNSSPQCLQFFYVEKGYHPYVDPKTKRPTCDDKALTRVARRYDSKEARLVQEIRGLRKLLSTYIEVEFDSDSRLRCSYDVRGTKTGRYSSKQTPMGTGLNFQNLDPRFKGFLVPDPEEE